VLFSGLREAFFGPENIYYSIHFFLILTWIYLLLFSIRLFYPTFRSIFLNINLFSDGVFGTDANNSSSLWNLVKIQVLYGIW